MNHRPYLVRIVYSYGDFVCFIKEYDENESLIKPVKLIHFGHRNTDYRGYYYGMKNEHGDFAEIIKEIAYRIYEKGNWSNNDRKRKGLKPINVKRKMEKHNNR
ncbi:hypothetical protein CDO73_01495 [Saccharibacillus sp. O23]|nr:hypothetical protein CDO73_01495 [Saccharibacillus sp. O23]